MIFTKYWLYFLLSFLKILLAEGVTDCRLKKDQNHLLKSGDFQSRKTKKRNRRLLIKSGGLVARLYIILMIAFIIVWLLQCFLWLFFQKFYQNFLHIHLNFNISVEFYNIFDIQYVNNSSIYTLKTVLCLIWPWIYFTLSEEFVFSHWILESRDKFFGYHRDFSAS